LDTANTVSNSFFLAAVLQRGEVSQKGKSKEVAEKCQYFAPIEQAFTVE